MQTTFSDTASGGTGWSAVAVTDASSRPERGGLVLKNIRHSGHNLARDVRVVKIWLMVEVVNASGAVTANEAYWFVLDSSGYFTASAVQELRPTPTTLPGGVVVDVLRGAADALTFDTYFRGARGHIGYGLRVDYTGRTGMFGSIANFEFSGMDVSQIFLFAHHGTSPPHEPSGALPAARFHPMLKYKLIANPSYDTTREHRRLSSIRFDYRMHHKLDALHSTVDAEPPSGNNAGLFRDTEGISLIVGLGVLTGVTGAERLVFESVEKPVVLEVTAPGLAKGASAFPTGPVSAYMSKTPSVFRCWDNVHWWGSGVGSNIISSPGAFHAAHMHWRWGQAVQGAAHGGLPVFGPGGAPAAVRGSFLGSWGVLVDPRIWIQSIRVAVVLNEASLDPDRGANIDDMSRGDWKTVFTRLRATPSDIFNPSDIVLWYSVEVHRTVTVPSITVFTPPNYTTYPGGTFAGGTEGVVCIHGIFFAHSPEQTGLAVGSRNTQHWPNSPAAIRRAGQWFRPA
jgi:hypothetical protein